MNFINGKWQSPLSSKVTLPVINPRTEEGLFFLECSSNDDVEAAVGAARKAFDSFSTTSVADRVAMFERICSEYKR
jgi:aldehyde dehydrogenase (NAD+)